MSKLKCHQPFVKREKRCRKLVRPVVSAADTRDLRLGQSISSVTRDHMKFQKGPKPRKEKSEIWHSVTGERLMAQVRRDIRKH